MDTWFDWNLFLDEKGGPNHVGNYCSAPIMLDGNGSYVKNPSYSYISLITGSIKPGAVRIAYTKYTDKLDVASFRNPDGMIVCILLNRSNEAAEVNLRIEGVIGTFSAPDQSITVIRCMTGSEAPDRDGSEENADK